VQTGINQVRYVAQGHHGAKKKPRKTVAELGLPARPAQPPPR
jgi:hypothetical protein